MAFVVVGAIGMAMERSVIRHLYGRPLETLLATWGISLILIQSVRLVFGAQNVEVANPDWLSGGIEVVYGVVLPWSRIAIVRLRRHGRLGRHGFLLQRTSLGLKVRAVTQNREMAGALGVSTHRVDMWTFGLGCGHRGPGRRGALPDRKRRAGTRVSRLHRRLLPGGGASAASGRSLALPGRPWASAFSTSSSSPSVGAVFGKILVLVFIILFIQRRPQGHLRPEAAGLPRPSTWP